MGNLKPIGWIHQLYLNFSDLRYISDFGLFVPNWPSIGILDGFALIATFLVDLHGLFNLKLLSKMTGNLKEMSQLFQ